MSDSAAVVGNLRVNVDTSKITAATEAMNELVTATRKAGSAIRALGLELSLVSIGPDGEETEIVEDAEPPRADA